LPQKLREELPGVLLWAVLQGCVEWNRDGLGSAPAVEAATAAYRAETDVYERFFGDACVFGPEVRVTKKGLFRAWESWCDAEGENPGKQVQLSRDMKEKGVVQNFEEKKSRENGTGRALESPQAMHHPPSEKNLPPAQKSRKHEGGASTGGKVSENFQNFSEDRTRVGGFPQIDENLPPEAKPSPLVGTIPIRWTEDGVEWEYTPIKETE
jgi:phage/plasmid-associated DNA primase